jgi:hypothetical protein
MKKGKKIDKQVIVSKYVDHILTHGERPANVYIFSKKLGIEEQEFYEHYASFESIEQSIFTNFFQSTLDLLNQTEEYSLYDSKTKLVSLYFTFFEQLNANRSLVLTLLGKDRKQLEKLKILSGFRTLFLEYIKGLELDTMEIPVNKLEKLKNKGIAEASWMQMLLVLKFWMEDNSPAFEKTDLFIEKSLNAGFDVISLFNQQNILDLGKFIWKEKLSFN